MIRFHLRFQIFFTMYFNSCSAIKFFFIFCFYIHFFSMRFLELCTDNKYLNVKQFTKYYIYIYILLGV